MLVIFAAIDLLQKDPPLSFLVITLVQLALGVATLVAIHKRRRDLVALAYVVVVLLTSLVHPVRSGQLLLLASLGLLAIGIDQLWQRVRPRPAEKPAERPAEQTAAKPASEPAEPGRGQAHSE